MFANLSAQRRYFLLVIASSIYCGSIFLSVSLPSDTATPPAILAAVALA